MGLTITPKFFSEALNTSKLVEFGLTDPVDLKIGSVTFKNVSFSTSKDVKANVIGLDLLRQLGAVKISKERLTLLPTAASSCKNKFRYSSMLWGTPMAARMPATIRGKSELVHLDTGASVILEASGVGLAGFPEKSLKQKEVVDVFGKKTLQYAESNVSMVIDNQAMDIDAIVTDQKAMVFPVSWRLGAGILKEKSIYFDAANGFACLEKL
ncbi:hypothetical protein XBLMG947_3130 [Xanthomonas bromi]|uniref:Aspartyl protease n=1 Tax=Xanthomonas bromi TaxID=56449 RepID=A0A1C3NPK1_9XANT|nr:hypothetical protein [Xanthomonas bromi]PPV05043.1 hypothetical protein XbrCFBP1976_19230 [Xanthomonas bromi]SBV52335.1 hypothetical protein XBLMG947_3130 [Xanthomonas bromi]